jgi:hypothetical protein
MLSLARSLASTGKCGAEEVSPFCIEAMYRSGIFYARRFRSTGDQSEFEALENIKAGLGVMNNRWKSAGMRLVFIAICVATSNSSIQGHTLKC